jgi:hemoglobin
MTEPPTAAASLYRRLGGHEAVAAIVDVFSRRLAADGELARYFARLDLEGLRRHQASFLDAALGGPQAYRGATLRRAHQQLGITARDFRLVLDHLAVAISACGVPEALGAEILGYVAGLSGEVVQAGH